MFADNGWRPGVIDALDILAEIALFQRKHERAVRLSAAAQTQRGILGLVPFPQACQRAEEQRAAAGGTLGAGIFARASRDGAALSLAEAVAYAQRGRGEHAGAAHGWASLSPVERQVVDLASNGVNNPTIATELFMSRNTVKAPLSHAYAKLGVANRIELARLAARRGADGDHPEQLYPRG
jgi:DNA-binding CsgD family transcriptional regulator